MPMPAAEIKQMILEAFPDARVEIRALAADNDHYSATVISEKFRGFNRVEQHKMVYDALKGRMGNDLHALALQTDLPKQN